jgi:asparagine synthase (glutamine-hydrolysing)
MCGIAGGWLERPIDPSLLRAAVERLHHRGPDSWGEHRDGPIYLAMRRLAILDLETGDQPIVDAARQLSLVYNGESYNYAELATELRASGETVSGTGDTAVLAPLYRARGWRMVEQLRGMFAIAIFDRADRRLFLMRDRFGKKPLYYAEIRGGGLVFASELKALVALARAAGHELRVRHQSVYDFLSLGVVPQPETIYEGVHVVPPGSVLDYDGRRVRLRRYWSLVPHRHERPYEALLEDVRDAIREAVRIRLRSDVPLGVFLSGGIDSSIVAYEAAQLTGSSLETFTVAAADPELDESMIAQRTARALGVRHTILPLDVEPRSGLEFLVRHYDQPFADSSAIPSLAIAKAARAHVKVVLNGDGGDELFAGYRRYLGAALVQWDAPRASEVAFARAFDRLGSKLGARRSGLGFVARLLRGASRSPGARYLVWTSDMLDDREKTRIWRGGGVEPTERFLESIAIRHPPGLDRQMLTDHAVNLASDLLVKMDMATMAHSLEARSPLLDHRVAELAFSIPIRQLLGRGRTKAILRDAYRGRLPEEVLEGKKRGFEVPLASWLAGPWSELIEDVVLAPSARTSEFLDPSFVRDLFARSDHLAERNVAYLRYAVLVLELWLRTRST